MQLNALLCAQTRSNSNVFRLQPYNVTVPPTHHTPNLYKTQYRIMCSKKKRKKVGKPYQRKPAPAGTFLLQFIIPRPYHSFLRSGKLEIPYIQHIEPLYLQSTSALYNALCNQVFYITCCNYVYEKELA